MEKIESYVFYRSFHEAFAELDIKEYGKIMYAINEYALNQNEEKVNALTGVLKSLWILIKPQLDANHRRREVGFKGGRPAKNNTEKKPMVFENDENKKPMVIFSDTEKKPNVNVNVNKNLNSNSNKNVNVNGETATNTITVTAPTLNDVKEFIKEQNLTVSAAKFFAHYNVKNWEGVKNWQEVLLRWEENQFTKTPEKKNAEENNYCRDAKKVLAELEE